MTQKKQKLIVILGPTASGKTGLSVALAKKLGGEIISADSRQIYRHLNIGTEKITKKEMQGIPHHCIDIASPRRSFSVEQWRNHARNAINSISHTPTHATHPTLYMDLRSPYIREEGVCYKVPIVAGGTGLYIDALVYGTDFPKVQPNAQLRQKLERMTPEELFIRLQVLDPARASTIEQKNPRRLVRAIEIATALGKVPSITSKKPLYDVTWIGINPPFDLLEERIARRLKKALKNGLVAETQKLRNELHISWKRINELGMEYRVCGAYLRGELPKEELEQKLIREVRRYAKRQLTWLKRYKDVVWYESAEDALQSL